ncbi:hypothetical protein DLJ47_28260 [Micromonospora sp. S4605]|uniref:hypothetical protein n=1 Tax=Micromonospora sp. S4605 TaxID=1420897 RepID=UPI000D6ED2E1|nr:hypothetical protein [Micromonospora sp. S4605]PWU48501.1 hypothetical protein DLJ47_28260 [Micromonospora sp. S4605]
MDADVMALARQAGQALVAAMASDAWAVVRDGLTRVYARLDESRAKEVAAALEDSRSSVLAGRSSPEFVATRWQGRLEALLEVYPNQAERLRDVVVHATSLAGADFGRQAGGGTSTSGNGQIIASNTGGGIIWS